MDKQVCDACGCAAVVKIVKSNGYTHCHNYRATLDGQKFSGPHVWLGKVDLDGESYDECTIDFQLCISCGKMQGVFPLPMTSTVAHFPQ